MRDDELIYKHLRLWHQVPSSTRGWTAFEGQNRALIVLAIPLKCWP